MLAWLYGLPVQSGRSRMRIAALQKQRQLLGALLEHVPVHVSGRLHGKSVREHDTSLRLDAVLEQRPLLPDHAQHFPVLVCRGLQGNSVSQQERRIGQI